MRAWAALEPAAVLAALETGVAGLSAAEAARRLDAHGPNTVAEHERVSAVARLLRAAANPLAGLLAVLAGLSFVGGDRAAGGIMLLLLAIGIGLRFVQEARADAAIEALRQMIRIHATVVRAGVAAEVPLEELVPGDVVQLAGGDMVPADVRVVTAKDLFVSQAVLTGEAFPVEKFAVPQRSAGVAVANLGGLCLLGASVSRVWRCSQLRLFRRGSVRSRARRSASVLMPARWGRSQSSARASSASS